MTLPRGTARPNDSNSRASSSAEQLSSAPTGRSSRRHLKARARGLKVNSVGATRALKRAGADQRTLRRHRWHLPYSGDASHIRPRWPLPASSALHFSTRTQRVAWPAGRALLPRRLVPVRGGHPGPTDLP